MPTLLPRHWTRTNLRRQRCRLQAVSISLLSAHDTVAFPTSPIETLDWMELYKSIVVLRIPMIFDIAWLDLGSGGHRELRTSQRISDWNY